jgi:hypothetical protein
MQICFCTRNQIEDRNGHGSRGNNNKYNYRSVFVTFRIPHIFIDLHVVKELDFYDAYNNSLGIYVNAHSVVCERHISR